MFGPVSKDPPRSAQAHPFFPPRLPPKQNLLDVYRFARNNRLRLATREFYEEPFVEKNVVFMRALWPLTEPGIRHVLKDNAANYERPAFVRATFAAIEGQGLLPAIGEHALRLRRIIASVFGQKYQLAGFDTFLSNNARLINEVGEREKTRQSFDLHALLIAWASSLNVSLIFSEDVAPHISTIVGLIDIRAKYFGKDVAFLLSLPESFPTPVRRKLAAARSAYLRIAFDVLEKRRQHPTEGDDLLNRLIRAKDETTGESITDAEIIDFTITFMSAGLESSATGITVALYLLALFPEIQERVREEALRVFGDDRPRRDDFAKLIYTQAAVDEALRYYPPIPITGRQAQGHDDAPFGPVKAGQQVLVFTWCVHHNRHNWDDPDVFRPERFLPENSANVPTFAYLPFGRGPRQCIGQQIARRAITLAVAELLANFEFSVDRDRPMEIVGGHSLLFPYGVHVMARRTGQRRKGMS